MPDCKWESGSRRILVCVDSYQKGVFQGRFYSDGQDAEQFESLSRFLNKMEDLLDASQSPQSHTRKRTFSGPAAPLESREPPTRIPKGEEATFQLQVIFRQHSSWQGVVVWLEKQWEQRFRSVLELIFLMDSALRNPDNQETPARNT